MKTKEQIMDAYAVSKNFKNWEDLVYMLIVDKSQVTACDEIIEHQNAVTDLIQIELLENISEHITTLPLKKIHKAILNTPIL